ncbi:rod-binding protein [Desulfosarcina sp.]|uniref:rod-binding protein n=1 Tax=Desulfosarcina sp. TaxID=2027861 RepID=UPI003970A555
MSDINALNTESTLFQLRASTVERAVSTVNSGVQRVGDTEADMEKASQQFEALMLNFMIREMRATVPESTLFPRSMAEEIFTGMVDEQIAVEMAGNGGIGISRMIFNQLRGEK